MTPEITTFPVADPAFSTDPAVRRAVTLQGIAATFDKLGEAGPGMGFAITTRAIDDIGSLDELIAALPVPDYPHRIFLDRLTDNILVERPRPDGSYYSEDKGYKRLR